jgi:ABC-2 type transport system permease protein/oleandomycin transport system permease protein
VALAFALVLAFAYVFSWISAYVGLVVRDPETAPLTVRRFHRA